MADIDREFGQTFGGGAAPDSQIALSNTLQEYANRALAGEVLSFMGVFERLDGGMERVWTPTTDVFSVCGYLQAAIQSRYAAHLENTDVRVDGGDEDDS